VAYEGLWCDLCEPAVAVDRLQSDYRHGPGSQLSDNGPRGHQGKALDLASIAAPDSVLFLWATEPTLMLAGEVMAAWGFEYKSHIVWLKKDRRGEKDRAGTGYWNRCVHEILLIGTRGKVPAPAPGTQEDSVIAAPVGEHSAKPKAFAEMIERLFPNLPKVELFRRGKPRPGWDAWGLEAE
jgi:N6-adenosine-specific RNA methylase IME4